MKLSQAFGVERLAIARRLTLNAKRQSILFYMFHMTIEEMENWKSQFVTSNFDKINMGLRKLPNVFTEQGIAMLSSVLKSDIAIEVNIQIIRVFTRIRKGLLDHSELRNEVEKIKNKLDNQDKNIEVVFRYLDELIEGKKQLKSRKKFGYEFGPKD